ncbi:MAG: serine protease [Bacillota bacterium]|nr:serine protease [Bacillota bacterium]
MEIEAFPAEDKVSPVQMGTGFVVAVGGSTAWVATAKHVVGNDKWAAIVLPGSPDPSGRAAETGDIRLDPSADLAILRVTLPHPLEWVVNPLPLGPVPDGAYMGEYDCVRGPGFAWQAYPVAVAASERFAGPTPGLDYLRTPAPVLPGCSGAPLVAWSDARGTVVGMVVESTWDPAGVGFVPADEIKRFLDEARSGRVAGGR